MPTPVPYPGRPYNVDDLRCVLCLLLVLLSTDCAAHSNVNKPTLIQYYVKPQKACWPHKSHNYANRTAADIRAILLDASNGFRTTNDLKPSTQSPSAATKATGAPGALARQVSGSISASATGPNPTNPTKDMQSSGRGSSLANSVRCCKFAALVH